MSETETIAAIATPSGYGGVGIIRISGPNAKLIAKTITKKTVTKTLIFSKFYSENNEIIDKGLVLYFKSPKSFTGDDVVEFQCHGSPIVLDRILNIIIKNKARLAKPGEFSERAFLNGKIDLTQAEAIADLINANSQKAAKLAAQTLEGNFSKEIIKIKEKIVYLRTYIEAAIDFSEEEIDVLNDEEIFKKLSEVNNALNELIYKSEQSVIFNEGVNLVIAGEPNVGKSSLMNALSGEEKAIVTEIPGTTRDVIKAKINLDGIPLHIIDTAGIRESKNIVEQEGIRRAINEIEKADRVLFLVDNEKSITNKVKKFFKKIKNIPPITIIKNKIDLTEEKPKIKKEKENTIIYISAKNNLGINVLKKHLKSELGFVQDEESKFLARRRHISALEEAKKYLKEAQLNFKKGIIELIAESLKLSQEAISQITGEFTTEDLLSKIFSTFCVGK